MPQPGIEIYGARELRSAMRRMGVEGQREALKEAHTSVADLVVDKSQRRGDPVQKVTADGLIPSGTTTKAQVRLKNTAANPFLVRAFMGSKKRTGWYSDGRYANSAPQWLEWVGNNWNLEAGTGPYVIAEVVHDEYSNILDTYMDEMRKAANRVGLNLG